MTNPKLSQLEQDDSSYVIYVSGKKKGRGEENLFKRNGRKGKIFSSPLPFLYDVTGIALFKSDTKSGQIGLSQWDLLPKNGTLRVDKSKLQ